MAPRRRKTKADEARERIVHLIAMDATNVVRRLRERREEMVTLFSRLRTREPLLETVHSHFLGVRFEELAQLEVPAQVAVNGFYESLESLRWYLRYTEDMPLMVRKAVVQHQGRLELAFAHLVEVLGAAASGSGPVVEVEAVREEPAVPRALASGAEAER